MAASPLAPARLRVGRILQRLNAAVGRLFETPERATRSGISAMTSEGSVSLSLGRDQTRLQEITGSLQPKAWLFRHQYARASWGLTLKGASALGRSSWKALSPVQPMLRVSKIDEK